MTPGTPNPKAMLRGWEKPDPRAYRDNKAASSKATGATKLTNNQPTRLTSYKDTRLQTCKTARLERLQDYLLQEYSSQPGGP